MKKTVLAAASLVMLSSASAKSFHIGNHRLEKLYQALDERGRVRLIQELNRGGDLNCQLAAVSYYFLKMSHKMEGKLTFVYLFSRQSFRPRGLLHTFNLVL